MKTCISAEAKSHALCSDHMSVEFIKMSRLGL